MMNPILASSALRRMRSARTMLIICVYVLVLLMVVVAVMSPILLSGELMMNHMNLGMTAYLVLLLAQFALMILVAPVMTASSIAGERERQTLELLLVTNTGSWQIVMGKLLESFAFIALLAVCSLPVMSLTMLTGGVTLDQILLGELFLLTCGFAAASVGVLCSSFMKNTVGATIVSYIVLLIIGVGTLLPLINGISNTLAGDLYDPDTYAAMTALDAAQKLPALIFVNPGVGLAALIEEQTGLAQSTFANGYGRIYAMFLLMKKIGCGVMAMLNMAVMIGLSFVLNAVAALLVRPRRVRIRRKA